MTTTPKPKRNEHSMDLPSEAAQTEETHAPESADFRPNVLER